jgi:hypothetical protein
MAHIKNRRDPLSYVKTWQKFYKKNIYYHKEIARIISHLIPHSVSVIEFGCKGGELLSYLPNKVKVGVDQKEYLQLAKKLYKTIHFKEDDEMFKGKKTKYNYILLAHKLSVTKDVQNFIERLKGLETPDSRIVVFYFNFIWKPVLDLAERLGLKLPQYGEPNWLSPSDIANLFSLSDYELVKSGRKILIPIYIPLFSNFVNKYIAPLPLVNLLCLMNYGVFRPVGKANEYSVSIIVPARNEAGNMKGVLKQIPKLGSQTEVIFVEGNSKDGTCEVIEKEIKKYKGPLSVSLHQQKGKGKGDGVRLGFSKAKNDMLMILDADLTVDPSELPKFYNAVASGKTDFVMGSRLIYPMEEQAMRTLNYFGNKFFSSAFTFLLGQRIKDTLCGTKVLLKKHYKEIEKNRRYFGNFDPFGDYDLIFGASKLNLKIVEIPIRYKERTYGTTNISRFKHGLLLFKMVGFAARKLKFV